MRHSTPPLCSGKRPGRSVFFIIRSARGSIVGSIAILTGKELFCSTFCNSFRPEKNTRPAPLAEQNSRAGTCVFFFCRIYVYINIPPGNTTTFRPLQKFFPRAEMNAEEMQRKSVLFRKVHAFVGSASGTVFQISEQFFRFRPRNRFANPFRHWKCPLLPDAYNKFAHLRYPVPPLRIHLRVHRLRK